MSDFKSIMFDIFAVLGIFFIIVLVHEIVHFIDGYGPNIAVCFGFINWQRMAFVINGSNYTLFHGELIAYGVNLLMAIGIFWLIFKRDK